MADAFLIIEDSPTRRSFLRKKLEAADVPWLLCDSASAVDSLGAMGANGVVIDVTSLRRPFPDLWAELKNSSGGAGSMRLILTGRRVSEIVEAQRGLPRLYCELYAFRTLFDVLGASTAHYRPSRRPGTPRWKKRGLNLLRTGIGTEPRRLSRDDWLRYALQYIHYQGSQAFFLSLLRELHSRLDWLRTVRPPEGGHERIGDRLNPLGTGIGPFVQSFSADEWLEEATRSLDRNGGPHVLQSMARVVERALLPWGEFERWAAEGRAYRIVLACPGIRMGDDAQDLSRLEATFVRLPASAEKKRALRVIHALEKLGIRFGRGYGFLEAWTTLPVAAVKNAIPERDRRFVFFLRTEERADPYLWPDRFSPTQDVASIPHDRPLSVEEIEISRLEGRGLQGQDEYHIVIPYPLKMTMDANGPEIRAAIEEILDDEDFLAALGMTADYETVPGPDIRFRASLAWASEGGFEVTPLDQLLEVEAQLRTYERRMESRYVYDEALAERLRFLGVELFNRLLANRRMKRIRM